MRNRTENQVKLVMIRHGKTESNRRRRYLGRTDEALCGEGREELLARKEKQCYPPVDVLFTSPMKRCIQTAKLLYPGTEPVRIEEWREMDFGVFEGKNYEELKNDERYRRWIDSGGTMPCPEGEGRADFILRCERGFKAMLGMLRGEEKTVGMAVHGGTIMALLSRYGGGDYFDYQTANGGGYLCVCKKEGSAPEIAVLARI